MIVRKFAFALACTMASTAILCLVFAPVPVRAAPEIGKPAPELVVSELDGATFDLAKLRGKVVLVNYWATWCAPCRKDMPKLDALYRRYHEQNLEMIGISVDRDSDLPKVRKVMAKLAYPVAVLKAVTNDGFGPPTGVPKAPEPRNGARAAPSSKPTRASGATAAKPAMVCRRGPPAATKAPSPAVCRTGRAS